jgi:hypothetical protein
VSIGHFRRIGGKASDPWGRHRKRCLGASALALVLVAAGCGGRGVDPAADARWAGAIVLRQSDLPAFDAQPPQGTGCLPGHLDGQSAFARSKRFDTLGRSAAARAWIFPGEKEAKAGFRALVRGDYARCLGRQQIAGGRILATRQEPFGPIRTGDRFRGVRIFVRLLQDGTPLTVYVDLLFVRRTRTVADAAFTSAGQPFGNAAEAAALLKMTARMERPPATGDQLPGRSSLTPLPAGARA